MSSLAAWARTQRRLFVSSILCTSFLCWNLSPFAVGQYPGHIIARKEKPAVLRATAVLEWTGEAGKPAASRVVPIAVFDGKTYQDAGIYLASPAPLAVINDTEYQLLRSGMAEGIFDVSSAGVDAGAWYGYGVWKGIHEAPPPKLAQSKVPAQIISDAAPGRPHFKSAGSSPDKKSDDAGTNHKDDSKASEDDKATLKKRSADSTTAPGTGTTQAPQSTRSAGDSSASAKNNPSAGGSGDPEHPHLRKRSSKSEPMTPVEPVTATTTADPDRPRLHRGRLPGTTEADHLTGMPLDLKQMIAVSDASLREPHSYGFQWANPDDAEKMQKVLEQIARNALVEKPASKPPATTRPRSRSGAANHSPSRQLATKQPSAKTSAAGAGPQLVEEDFRAFELAYSGGSTLVFTARTIDDGTPIRYVTLIAQPDFYGVPRILFKQITDANHLNITPRLRLIDAVDTDADNRAELIFEERGKTDRQFAIYSVKSTGVDQVFATGSLPW